MDEFDEIVREFLVESYENLDQLDRDLVALEQEPDAHPLLQSIFRTIHTIKGTSGFLAFGNLEALTHAGEGLLARLRDGGLRLTQERTTGLLELVDAVRGILASIEATGAEYDRDHSELVAKLTALQEPVAAAEAVAVAAMNTMRSRGAATGANRASGSNGTAADKPGTKTVAKPAGKAAVKPAVKPAARPSRRASGLPAVNPAPQTVSAPDDSAAKPVAAADTSAAGTPAERRADTRRKVVRRSAAKAAAVRTKITDADGPGGSDAPSSGDPQRKRPSLGVVVAVAALLEQHGGDDRLRGELL